MNYCVSHEFIHIYTLQSPRCLFERLDSQSNITNHPLLVKLYEKCSRKVGKQSFANKVALVSKLITFDWFHTRLSSDSLRVKLKMCLFKYPSVLFTLVPGELENQLRQH
jgi:hypothetical protein